MKIEHTISDHYGEGGRLKKAADPLLVDTAYLHDCEDADILMPYLTQANIGHLLVLTKGAILPVTNSKSIMDGLLKLKDYQLKDFTIDPKNGDIYNNYDIALKNIIGDEAGWLHAGRPRREAVNVAFLLALREEIMPLILEANNLLNTIIKKSEEHKQSIMPDYTYLLHAQPTSFGHYLLTFAYPLQRDIERLKEMFSRVNSSPGESGSVNGSRLNLDKEYFSKLLGFEQISYHSRDAMWQPDMPLEVISNVASILMNISRLAEEFQIWNTKEFGFLELPDSLCRASVIMPQKKNPYPLAYMRGLANLVIGKFSSYGAYGRIATGNPDSRIFIYGDLVKTVKKTRRGLELMNQLIREVSVLKENFWKQIISSDAYATDIADEILKQGSFNYREAHQIVGKVTRLLLDKGLNLKDMEPNDLNMASIEITGKKINIDRQAINKLLNPKEVVASRTTKGGAAISELEKMYFELKAISEANNQWIIRKNDFFKESNNYLSNQIKNVYA